MSVGGTSFIGFRYIAPGPGLCLDKTKTKMPLITSNIDLFIGSQDRIPTMPDQTSRQKILAGKLGWYQNLRALLLILNLSVIWDIPHSYY